MRLHQICRPTDRLWAPRIAWASTQTHRGRLRVGRDQGLYGLGIVVRCLLRNSNSTRSFHRGKNEPISRASFSAVAGSRAAARSCFADAIAFAVQLGRLVRIFAATSDTPYDAREELQL